MVRTPDSLVPPIHYHNNTFKNESCDVSCGESSRDPDNFLRFSNGDMGIRMTNTEPTVGRRSLVRQGASVVGVRIRMSTAQSSKDIHQHMCFEHKHKPVQDPLVGNGPSKIS